MSTACTDGAARRALPALLLCLLLGACGGGGGGGGGSPATCPGEIAAGGTLAGKVCYADLGYGLEGLQADPVRRPVRGARVELLDAAGALLASAVTAADGSYGFGAVAAGATGVRVLAQGDEAAVARAEVRDLQGNLYAVLAPLSGAPRRDLVIADTAGAAGAFNIYAALADGLRFLASLGASSIGVVKAYWTAGDSSFGTYTCGPGDPLFACPNGEGIYLWGGVDLGGRPGGDFDHYDDDVILHEMAHVVESALGILDSPGGDHRLEDNDLDLRLAWSEGLGAYFPAAVKRWLAGTDPQSVSADPALAATWYIDTQDTGGVSQSLAFDFGRPQLGAPFCPQGNDCYRYASNEVAVAKALIAMTEAAGDAAWWNVLAGPLAQSSAGARPASLDTYWEGWLGLGLDPAAAAPVLAERAIGYVEDGNESLGDDEPATAAAAPVACSSSGPCLEVQRSLYRAGAADRDVLALDLAAGNYRFSTYDLRDGLDTEILVYAADGLTRLAGNDDAGTTGTQTCDTWSGVSNRFGTRNDGSNYASRVDFLAASPGRVYLTVRLSGDGPCPGGGRVGGYSLRVEGLD